MVQHYERVSNFQEKRLLWPFPMFVVAILDVRTLYAIETHWIIFLRCLISLQLVTECVSGRISDEVSVIIIFLE